MDKTETYIKQCEKAEEIQEGHKWVDDDIWGFMHSAGLVESGYYNHLIVEEYQYEIHELTWLPRQDQLQEMAGDYEHNLSFIIQFGNEATHYDYKADVQYYLGYGTKYMNRGWDFTSMEQLWLAFVMERNYGKRWDGTDWVKEKD